MGEAHDVHQFVGVVVVVDARVGKEEGATLGVENVHGGKMSESGLDADDLFCYLHRVAAAGIGACDEGIGLAGLDHHHAKVVAVIHLLPCLKQIDAVALVFLGKHARKAVATRRLAVVTRIDDGDALDVHVEASSALGYHLLVAQQDGDTSAVVERIGRCLEHIVGIGLSKHHALGMTLGGIGEATQQFVVVAQQAAQLLAVHVEVGDGTRGHTAVHSGLSHSTRHHGNQSRVERLGQDIFRPKGDVVHLVGGIDDGRHVALRQIGNGVNGGKFHGTIDFGGTAVDGTAEDIGEP